MRSFLTFTALPFLLTACGSSSEGSGSAAALKNAAEQSDPAAAAVLDNAAENGMNPQDALQQAGNAQASVAPEVSVQAKPNRASDRNPAQPGQPPEKTVTNTQ